MAFILIPFFVFLSACTTTPSVQYYTAVFNHSYPLVWEAVLLALKKYPIAMEHQDSGQIETKFIRNYKSWKPPKGSVERPHSRKYKLKLFLEKGSSVSNTPAVKVHIMKEEFMDEDFIQQSIPISSNGLEEEVLLYRIERELFLMNQKKKFHERKKQKDKDKPDDEEEDLIS